MQDGPHSCCPGGQTAPQLAPSQVARPPSGTGHGMHALPQLLWSVLDKQASPHWWVPSTQTSDIDDGAPPPALVTPPASTSDPCDGGPNDPGPCPPTGLTPTLASPVTTSVSRSSSAQAAARSAMSAQARRSSGLGPVRHMPCHIPELTRVRLEWRRPGRKCTRSDDASSRHAPARRSGRWGPPDSYWQKRQAVEKLARKSGLHEVPAGQFTPRLPCGEEQTILVSPLGHCDWGMHSMELSSTPVKQQISPPSQSVLSSHRIGVVITPPMSRLLRGHSISELTTVSNGMAATVVVSRVLQQNWSAVTSMRWPSHSTVGGGGACASHAPLCWLHCCPAWQH